MPMTDVKIAATRDHFIKRFPSDPEFLRTSKDVIEIERVPEEERFPCNSPNEALATVAAHYPDDVALTWLPNGSISDTPQRWTYASYHQEVIRAANMFHSLGLGPEDSVILLLPNVPELIFSLWGAQAVGVAAPINPYLEPEQIAAIAEHAEAKILVTLGIDEPEGEELFQKAQIAQQNAPGVRHIITVGKHSAGTDDSVIRWEEAIAVQSSDDFVFKRAIEGHEIAAYFHTGGTTGTPKLAQHRQRAEVVNVCQMIITGSKDLGNGSGLTPHVILCALPMFHVNGAFVSLLSTMMHGGEMILAGPEGFRNKTLVKEFWALIERYRVTYFSGVPTIFPVLMEQDVKAFDISSLVFCASGGAPLPRSLLRNFQQYTGAEILEGYGMTETTAAVSTHYFYSARHVGSTGIRLPYVKTRPVILDAEGGIERDCEVDEIGVLLHRGPNLFAGYKQSAANKNIWPELDWFNSGDMGRIDADGYTWLVGRAKDLIIRGGHNIDPLITEEALTRHPAVQIAAAVGKPDARLGELPVAYVQLVPGETASAEELVAYAREHAVERAAAPAEVIFREALEQSAVGKVLKLGLRKDIIARAYREALVEAWPDARIDAEVVDDSKLGMKVELKVGGLAGSAAELEQSVADVLADFSTAWELV